MKRTAIRAIEIYRKEGFLFLLSRIKFRLKLQVAGLVLVWYRLVDIATGRCVENCWSFDTQALYWIHPSTEGLEPYFLWYDLDSPHRRRSVVGEYEVPVMDELVKYVGDDAVFWEVGSAWGYHSMALADEFGHVYAFEPDESRYKLLQRSIEANSYDNVDLITETVDSLDDYADDLDSPDVILMDIEGGEFSVIPESERLLDADPVWIVEIHTEAESANTPGLESLFEKRGYAVEVINERGPLSRFGRERTGEIHTYHVVAGSSQ